MRYTYAEYAKDKRALARAHTDTHTMRAHAHAHTSRQGVVDIKLSLPAAAGD